jgi:RNA polymerase sigma-70 factor (ECF subfamily)
MTSEAGSSRKHTRADGSGPAVRCSCKVSVLDSHADWSDIALIEAVIKDCGDAYAEVFRRHSRSVASAARMILGNTRECEDVVADVFIGLWITPEKFDPTRGSLLGFLRLKSKARSIDILRSTSSRRRRESYDLGVDRDLVEDVDSALLASESKSLLRDALALLPAVEQNPIYLAFFVGMPYSSVAEQLQLPEGTVKSRIRSGLLRLRMSGDLQEYLSGRRQELGDVPSPMERRSALGATGTT